jgi:hypothetical protein
VIIVQHKRKRGPRPSARLPFELFAEIASWFEARRELVSFGKVSFQLLEIAMRELMVKRPVRLETTEQMCLFFCQTVSALPFIWHIWTLHL